MRSFEITAGYCVKFIDYDQEAKKTWVYHFTAYEDGSFHTTNADLTPSAFEIMRQLQEYALKGARGTIRTLSRGMISTLDLKDGGRRVDSEIGVDYAKTRESVQKAVDSFTGISRGGLSRPE